MGQACTRTDFFWVDDPIYHLKRQKEILKKHPEVKALFGYDKRTKWILLAAFCVQIATLFIIDYLSFFQLFMLAYFFTGVINHSFTLAIHEISHNLAFGAARPIANNCLGIFVNLTLCVPVYGSFKKYHREHHKYMSVDGVDTDLPTALEGVLFHRTGTKLIWLALQPFFYAFRPMLVYPRKINNLEIVNAICVVIFDVVIYNTFGPKCLAYLMGSYLITMGLHPMAGHFISEHYMFKEGFETYSYYGWMNWIMFNVGYHNEHHDFPNVPFTRLPELRVIAPEFYNHLPHHKSLTKVVLDWVFDPNIGPYTRVKRKQAGFVNWEADPHLQ